MRGLYFLNFFLHFEFMLKCKYFFWRDVANPAVIQNQIFSPLVRLQMVPNEVHVVFAHRKCPEYDSVARRADAMFTGPLRLRQIKTYFLLSGRQDTSQRLTEERLSVRSRVRRSGERRCSVYDRK